MNQDVYSITEFLIERAKDSMHKHEFKNMGYFILRYPDKPKLVYAQLDASILMVPFFWQFMPFSIQEQWNARPSMPGVELVAVCLITKAMYSPQPETICDFPNKLGQKCLSTTINMANERHSAITFYEQNQNNEYVFEENLFNKSSFTSLGRALFPKV